MENGSFCLFLSIRTGGAVIGILTGLAFVHNLVCSIIISELVLYFGVNTVIYGTVTCFFLRQQFAKDRKYYLYTKPYFQVYLGLVYFVGNIWNFVFWYCMPEYLADICKEDPKCIRFY